MARKTTCSTRPSALLAQVVLLMASSVSALTLSDFQSIATATVPLGCIMVYNTTPLSGCSQTDFTVGSGCASNCVRSLRHVQSTLQDVCTEAAVPARSVLSAALQGSLVDALCGRGLEPSPRTTRTRTTLTPSLSRPSSPPPAATSSRRLPPPPPPPPASSTSAPTSRGPPSLTPVPVPVPVPSVVPAPSSESTGNGTPGTPSPTEAPAPTSTQGPEETTTAPPQSPGQAGQGGQGGQRGGGSPFDPVAVGGAQHALPTSPIAVLAWASAVGLFIMEGIVL